MFKRGRSELFPEWLAGRRDSPENKMNVRAEKEVMSQSHLQGGCTVNTTTQVSTREKHHANLPVHADFTRPLLL